MCIADKVGAQLEFKPMCIYNYCHHPPVAQLANSQAATVYSKYFKL